MDNPPAYSLCPTSPNVSSPNIPGKENPPNRINPPKSEDIEQKPLQIEGGNKNALPSRKSTKGLIPCICFKIHINHIAFAISILMLGMAAFTLVGAFFIDENELQIQIGMEWNIFISLCLINFIVHSANIAALKMRIPRLFLPFLILAGFGLAARILKCFLSIGYLFLAFVGEMPIPNSSELAIFDPHFMIQTCIFALIYAVIWRAWNLMKMDKIRKINKNTMGCGQSV